MARAMSWDKAPVVDKSSLARASTMVRAILRAKRSSPRSRRIRSISSSSARRRKSAAVSPCDWSMRMSSGPLWRNENPRSARSSCMDDTPKSTRQPSTNWAPTLSNAERSDPNGACASGHPVAIRRQARPRPFDGIAIPIDADQPAIGRRALQDGVQHARPAQSWHRSRCPRRSAQGTPWPLPEGRARGRSLERSAVVMDVEYCRRAPETHRSISHAGWVVPKPRRNRMRT